MVTRAPGRRSAALVLTFTLVAWIAAPYARAGQVRITVQGSGFSGNFSPRAANLNLGDHAVWVWTASGHSVTSGDSSTVAPDGSFNVGGSVASASSRFSWKSDRTGHVPYFCIPHAPEMAGRLIVSNPPSTPKIDVSDFRITEVQFNLPPGQDLVEITNYGAAQGNLGRYRLAIAGTGTGVEVPVNDFAVPAGGRVVIHVAASGVPDATNLYMSALPNLPDPNGSLALYVPGTFAPFNALTRTDMIIDFVQWGAGGQANEVTAVNANPSLWSSGTSINNVAADHSIEYCANATLDHGVGRWAEVSTPSFGTNGDCTTPVPNATWGRIKTLYR